MAETTTQQQPRPRNLFELINQNVVELSQDVVKLYAMVADIHTAIADIHASLYPPQTQEISEPNAGGAETINQ